MNQEENNEVLFDLSELEAEQEKKLLRRKCFTGGLILGAAIVLAVGVIIPQAAYGIRKAKKAESQAVADAEAEKAAEEAALAKAAAEELLDEATIAKLGAITSYIQAKYYEDVDIADLQEGLYRGLFENLDEYSRYYSAEEYKKMYEDSITGSFAGIGAVLTQDSTTKEIIILRVYEDSAAEECGLREGDVILSADGFSCTEAENTSDFVQHVRGEEGTSVHLEIYRDGEVFEVDAVRKIVEMTYVSGEMLDDEVGYIAISEFSDPTDDQFRAALKELQGQNMKKLIIDLRNNPGGRVDIAFGIADMLLPEGRVVYTQTKDGVINDYVASDETTLIDVDKVPMIVLVNGNSASASEILTGTLKDRKAATILGTQTYGKGVVQVVQNMSDGSAFKVTNSRYYTPNGDCIDGVGITPDVELEYEFLGGEDDVYSYEFDNQLQKALELLNKE